MRSKRLLRQLKKTLMTESFEDDLQRLVQQLELNELPKDSQLWAERFTNFSIFLDSIENSYLQNETMLELANRSLEVSTKELFEANEKSQLSNRAITAMVNSLDEGFLVIDPKGYCGQVVSLAAKKFLGRDPVGEKIVDILQIPKDDQEIFDEWLNMVFNEIISFEDLIELAPKTLNNNSGNQKIEIKFKPIRSLENQKIVELVLILTDVSDRVEAERKLGEQKLFTELVLKYLNNKPNFIRIIQMAIETADSMKTWIFNFSDLKEQTKTLLLELHTLKGGLNTLSMYSLGNKIHHIESELLSHSMINNNLLEKQKLVQSLGHELTKNIEDFLVKHRSIFKLDTKVSSVKEISTDNVYRFCSELLKLGLTDLLRNFVDDIIAVPLISLFAPVESNVYTQAIALGKSVDLIISDPKNIRVIPEFYSHFFEQMVHIFNNMLDHGIEPIEERGVLNKPISGKIEITLDLIDSPEKGKQKLKILLRDDGRGIDPIKIRKIMTEKGVDVTSENDEQILLRIFDHGFSSKEVTSITSGRGVGMAAVLNSVHRLGGEITIESKVGSGTAFKIQLPYVHELNSQIVADLKKTGEISTLQVAAG